MKIKRASLRYGWFSTLALLLAAALLVMLNAAAQRLEKENGWRIDCSFNSITTQSDTTLRLLAELKHPVHIYAFFTREDAPLMELLDHYHASSPLVTWERADLSLNPALAVKFSADTASGASVSQDCLVVYCEETDRWRIINLLDTLVMGLDYESGQILPSGLRYESELTAAIVYASQEEIPQIRLLQGHEELPLSQLGLLAELLSRNNYELSEIRLSSGEALDPAELLLVLSPVRDLMDAELTALTDFCARGGRLFITCDFSDPMEEMPNWQALLRSYGFLPKSGIVVAAAEEKDSYYDQVQVFLLPTLLSTDATIDLVAAGADTLLLPGCRAFEMPSESDRNLTVRPVLTASSRAYLRNLSAGSLDDLTQQAEDEQGPFALALQATRVTEAGEISRAFILGCSAILTSSQVQAMTASQEFIMTMVQYLAGGERIELDIMPKAAMRPQLSPRSLTAGVVVLVALPLLAAAAGVLVLLPRRRR